MFCRPVLLWLCLLPVTPGLSSSLRAQQVLVTGVEGQVLYGAGAARPSEVVKSGQRLGPGTFSAGNDGILYLSAFDGSELRAAESATLTYDGDDHLCTMEGPGNDLRSNFHLKQGKLLITIRLAAQPRHCYHIVLARAAIGLADGQCVLCQHGVGTYVFVARGRVAVTSEAGPENPPQRPSSPHPESPRELEPIRMAGPLFGTVPTGERTDAPSSTNQTQWLVGNGKVGVVGIDGDVRILPLSAVAAGTQTCLLAGFNPQMAEGGGKPGSPDSNPPLPHPFRRFPVVSPTQ